MLIKLRNTTGAPLTTIRKALETASNDFEKAREILATSFGTISSNRNNKVNFSYIGVYRHHDGAKAGILKLGAETDFTTRSKEFRVLADDLAMQITATEPKTVDELLSQDYVANSSLTVQHLIQDIEGKCKETVKILGFKVL